MGEISIGIVKEISVITEKNMLASNVGSGTLDVLATPAVATLMEKASYELVQPYLPDGITTVGTMLTINHISATPPGAKIIVRARLADITDRKYTFELTAMDDAGFIATGKHERFTVKSERFTEKTYNKFSGQTKG